MNTYNQMIISIHGMPQSAIYGVIAKTKNGKIERFKITTYDSEICKYINEPPVQDCQFSAFTSAYEAGAFVKSNLTFDEIFHFQIEGESLIELNRWYMREQDNIVCT